MDRETTQRLLKESIIFLCRTYIGVISDFEVDGIICISHDDGTSDQQHVVFKIHELVSREAVADTAYPDCFGPELDFEGCGSLRTAGPWRRSGSKKRKISNHLPSQNTFNFNKRGDNQLSYANSIPVFPEFKTELPWPDEPLKSNPGHEAISKGDFASVHKTKQIDDGVELAEYSCYGCELSCPTKKILDKHMLSVHELSAYCFCKTCVVGFIKADDFDAHNLLVHPGCNNVAGMMVNDETDTAQPESKSPRADDFKSVISSSAIFPINSKNHQIPRNCRQSSSSRISSASSLLVATGALDTKAAILSVLPEEQPDAEDAIIDQSAPRACALCDSGFSDFPMFNIHCKEVHNIFACPYCKKTFSQQSERDNHLFKHTGEKPFECPDCALSFSRLDSLRRHRMKIHGLSWTDVVVPDFNSGQLDRSGNDEFDGVNDGTPRSLVNHVGGSTGVNPSDSSWMDGGSDPGERQFEVARSYPGSCQSSDAIEISDEESISRSTRNRYRNIKTLDPDRTFVCEICRETIQGTAAFRDHCDTVHRRVPCPYCGGTFTQKASMERHQRQHTGERPFRCQFCEHTYTRKENLQTHMLRLHPLLLDME